MFTWLEEKRQKQIKWLGDGNWMVPYFVLGFALFLTYIMLGGN